MLLTGFRRYQLGQLKQESVCHIEAYQDVENSTDRYNLDDFGYFCRNRYQTQLNGAPVSHCEVKKTKRLVLYVNVDKMQVNNY